MTNLFDLIDQYTAEPVPIQIEHLIEDLGIELDKKADLPDDIAGEISCLGNNKYKISVNKNDHYFRKRFTMAHELAHFLFHRSLLGDGVIKDSRLYRSTNPVITPHHEVQANKFAAELLMPLKHVRKDYKEMNKDIQKVAAKWQVSPQAMEIRLGLKQ